MDGIAFRLEELGYDIASIMAALGPGGCRDPADLDSAMAWLEQRKEEQQRQPPTRAVAAPVLRLQPQTTKGTGTPAPARALQGLLPAKSRFGPAGTRAEAQKKDAVLQSRLAAQEARKRKRLEQQDKARLRAEIEADRRERQRARTQRAGARSGDMALPMDAAAAAAAVAPLPMPQHITPESMAVVRLVYGRKTTVCRVRAGDQLSVLMASAVALAGGRAVVLLQRFPKQEFGPDDLGRTLIELRLVPKCSLTVADKAARERRKGAAAAAEEAAAADAVAPDAVAEMDSSESPAGGTADAQIQVRFEGRTFTFRVSVDGTLASVLQRVLAAASMARGSLELRQAFPRRVFGAAELQLALTELGLGGRCSLIASRVGSGGIRMGQPEAMPAPAADSSEDGDGSDDGGLSEDGEGGGEDAMGHIGGELGPMGFPAFGAPAAEEGGAPGWGLGAGYVLGDTPTPEPAGDAHGEAATAAAAAVEDDVDMADEAPEERDGDAEEGAEAEAETEAARRAAMRESRMRAWKSRRAEPTTATAAEAPRASREPDSLLDLCLFHICRRLHATSNPIMSLRGVSSQLAERLLGAACKINTLRTKTLQAFAPCHLRHVQLSGYDHVTDEFCGSLRGHHSVVDINFSHCRVLTKKAIQHLASLKRLRRLDLSGCRLRDSAIPFLCGFAHLTHLSLNDLEISDSAIQALFSSTALCEQLVEFSVNGCTALTDAALSALQGAKHLTFLGLAHTQASALALLPCHASLRRLDLRSTRVDDESVAALAALDKLQVLDLSSTAITQAGLAHIRALVALTKVALPSHMLPDAAIMALPAAPLEELDLKNFIAVTDVCIPSLVRFASSLRALDLSNTKITNAAMPHVFACSHLVSLSVARTGVTSSGLRGVQGLHKLLSLDLSSTRVSNALLKGGALGECPCLQSLNLSATRVTDRGLVHLKARSLVRLNLARTRATPACLAHFESSVSVNLGRPIPRDDITSDEDED